MLVHPIGFEWCKNDENRIWGEKFRSWEVGEMREMCFCVADI
jgi:hypothetical protein